MSKNEPIGVYVLIIGGAIGFMLGLWWVAAYMEASTYNRVTGANVSTWDALWIELRVQGGPTHREPKE